MQFDKVALVVSKLIISTLVDSDAKKHNFCFKSKSMYETNRQVDRQTNNLHNK